MNKGIIYLMAATACWTGAPTGIITKGVDGDTVQVKDTTNTLRKIRIIGIDTPESYYQGQNQGAWATKASERAQEVLPLGTNVTLSFDAESQCDSYGRALARVAKEGKDYGATMIEEGLAYPFCINKLGEYCNLYAELADAAVRAGIGAISDKTVIPPYEWRSKVRGEPLHYRVFNITTMHEDGLSTPVQWRYLETK